MHSLSFRTIWLLFLLLAISLGACERQTGPGQAGELRATKLGAPLERPDLTFTDTQGRPYDFRAETEGKVTLLFFGYTHCPDICPMHMANIAAVMEDLPFHLTKDLEVLFVTVDPERDTPERVRTWLNNFSPRFKGLFVDDPATLTALEHSLNLPNAVTMPAASGGYDVGHGTQVFAFGRTGPAHYVYPFGVRQRDWAHDLPILLQQGAGPQDGAKGATPKASPSVPGEGDSAMEILLAIIPSPPPKTPAALYATILNHGAEDALVGLSTPMADHAMLHTMAKAEDGSERMTMQHVDEMLIRAHGQTQLRPGEYHGMFVGLSHRYASGETVPVTLTFRDAGTMSVTARVVDSGAGAGALDEGERP